MHVAVNISSTTDTESGYSDSIAVSFEIEGMLNATRTIHGTVYGEDELRITDIDGFEVEFWHGLPFLVMIHLCVFV